MIAPDPFFITMGEKMGALAVQHPVPAIFEYRRFANAGGLASYGASLIELYRLAGVYTGRILKGEKPADLPVQESTKVEMIINMKTAKALGITVPISISRPRRRGDRMRRREFIALVGGAAVARPLSARAADPDRIKNIDVILNYAETDPEGQARFSALREQLQKLGWTEGSNIRIESRWAAGRPDLMLTYAAQLVSQPADIIVVNSTPLLAVLKRLTSTIPIVFTQVADPVGSGFVSNYARPGGNITGFTDFDTSIAEKWVEVLKEVVPSVNRMTVLLDPDQLNHRLFLRSIQSAAPALKVQISVAEVHNRAEIGQAISSLAGQAGSGFDRPAGAPRQYAAGFDHPVDCSLSPAGSLSV